MKKNNSLLYYSTIIFICLITACVPTIDVQQKKNEQKVPKEYKNLPGEVNKASQDSSNTAQIKWKDFFKDQKLKSLIDTALKNNQELN
ncbi:MAG: TolC family protein, partial [Flavobacteriales bacterium]